MESKIVAFWKVKIAKRIHVLSVLNVDDKHHQTLLTCLYEVVPMVAVVVVVAGSVWLLASWREELQSSLLYISSGTSTSDTEGKESSPCREDAGTSAQKTEGKNIPLKSLIEYSRKTHEDPRMKVNLVPEVPRWLAQLFSRLTLGKIGIVRHRD